MHTIRFLCYRWWYLIVHLARIAPGCLCISVVQHLNLSCSFFRSASLYHQISSRGNLWTLKKTWSTDAEYLLPSTRCGVSIEWEKASVCSCSMDIDIPGVTNSSLLRAAVFRDVTQRSPERSVAWHPERRLRRRLDKQRKTRKGINCVIGTASVNDMQETADRISTRNWPITA